MLSLLLTFFFAAAAALLYFALRPRSVRLAALAAAALVLLGISLSVALTWNLLDAHPEVDASLVSYELLEAAPVEFGTRLRARFHNQSPARLYSIQGVAHNLSCQTGDSCQESFEVRIPIPASRSYTQSWTVRIPSTEQDQWQLTIDRVQAFATE